LRLVLLSRPRPCATAHLASLEDVSERGDDHLGVIGTGTRTVEAIRRWACLGAAARLSRGIPTTPNGLALCKIHHAAYDQNMLGVSPDYKVSINREVLARSTRPACIDDRGPIRDAVRRHAPQRPSFRPRTA
jgi:hypothetical protein